MSDIRSYNVGNSNYSRHSIQPWDIWIDWKLNPFDADIIKRTLRVKKEQGMSSLESRKMDYEKIIHICMEMQRQNSNGVTWDKCFMSIHKIYPKDIRDEYHLCDEDFIIIEQILRNSETDYETIIQACCERIRQIDKELND